MIMKIVHMLETTLKILKNTIAKKSKLSYTLQTTTEYMDLNLDIHITPFQFQCKSFCTTHV